MFSLDIIDTDDFLEMPVSARELYFQFGMRADDDGFLASYRKIMKITGASDDDLRVLSTKKFIINFENGIIVIRHWKIHNYIQSDRYTETIYKDEKSGLIEKDRMYNKCIQNGYTGKVSKDKDSIDKVKKEKAERNIIPPTIEMVKKFCEKRNNKIDPQGFIDHYEARGWKPKGYTTKMKDWQATIRTWEKYDINKQPNKFDNNSIQIDTSINVKDMKK